MAEPSDPNKPILKELSGLVGSRYEILRLLGKGAMGFVYVAHDVKMDRDVALKVMAAQIADDPELKTRFEREAKEIGKIQHPNLVTVFDFDYHTDGSPYFAMELLKGQDLHRASRQSPPLTLERKVSVIVQVLAGLAHAHEKGIIHRDIKPANIFIQEDGSVKIMDFGVARLPAASLTGTGNIVGTADYMSPEQVKGENKKVDGRSDIFSVGCMLFELAAGRRPFHSDNLMAIFYKITHEEANFDLIPQGAEYDALMPILKKALAKDVGERYQTAYAFAVDLREWLKAHATATSSPNPLESLVDLEAPTHPPLPVTEAPGVTSAAEGGPTVDLGRRGPRQATVPPPRAGSRSAAGAAAVPTMRPGPTRVVTAPPTPRAPARPQPAPRPSVLPWVALALALVGVVGYVAWKSQQAPATPPATLAVATPAPPPPTTLATPAPAPVATAPAPTLEEAGGPAAARIRSALAVRLRSAEAALARGDLDAAESELEAARRLAPWDRGVADLSARVVEARTRAARDAEASARSARATQINGLLAEATSAMERKQYEAAIAAYNRALEIEPGNQVATIGKSNALTAKTVAEAAASGPRSGPVVRTFVAGRTEAKGTEQGGLVGFEDSAGVEVKRGTAAAELPGKIFFEASPTAPKPGERFKVGVFLVNEGQQAIPLASMTVATVIDGRRQRGFVPLPVTTVAPGQRAPVYQTPSDQVWREGTQSWSMEIVLQTTKGETYRNTLSWK